MQYDQTKYHISEQFETFDVRHNLLFEIHKSYLRLCIQPCYQFHHICPHYDYHHIRTVQFIRKIILIENKSSTIIGTNYYCFLLPEKISGYFRHKRNSTEIVIYLKKEKRSLMNIPTRNWKAKVFMTSPSGFSFHSKKLCGTSYNGPFLYTETAQEMIGKANQEALNEESIQMTHDRVYTQIYRVPVFKCENSRRQLLIKVVSISSIRGLPCELNHSICIYARNYPYLI